MPRKRKPKPVVETTHTLAERMRREEQTVLHPIAVRVIYYTQYQRFMSKCP